MELKIMAKPLQIKTKGLKNAIKCYFDIKEANNGYFLSTLEKDEVCDMIIRRAHDEGKSCAIVPGLIILKTKTKVLEVDTLYYYRNLKDQD